MSKEINQKLNEDTLSEKPALDQLKAMGYSVISGDRFDPQEREDSERSSRKEVILVDKLKKKLVELNPDASEETIEKAIRHIVSFLATGILEENQSLHKDLVANKSFEQDSADGRRYQTIRYFDYENPKNNEFLAVNQFWVKGPKENARPDIVVFINGIPVVVIECKSPVAKDTGVVDALDQLIRYQKEIPSLFRTNQILIGCNVFGARYGTVGANPEDFHEWKANPEEKLPILKNHPAIKELIDHKLINEKDLPATPASQDMLIACLLNKENLIDIVRNFVVFDTNERGRIIKKICRYQQWLATRKIVKRVLSEPDKKGIVWHWQGSGKSLTMLFTALKLKREEKNLKNPFIVIVSDRKDLDEQITGNFRKCGFPNPERAASSNDLYQMLSGPIGRTIMTTVQKFRNPVEKPLSEADNIIILTDEAHRTQYGNLAFNMRKALPNASFFAFTGTPLNKKDRNTYRMYSPANENYLDRYSIQQSEDDNATKPIKYVSRMAELQIAGNSLDSMLRNLFPEKDKQELSELKRKYSSAEILANAPRRIERIAMDILEHYTRHIRPNGLKAMIVANSREAAVEYKNALDRITDPEISKVIMTSEQGDPDEWKQKYNISDTEEREIKERFKDPRNPLSFLIVCDKLLTGFDAPVLQVIYLDKMLREHTLLQAVARTNRVYYAKGYGLIVDYIGIGKELAEAVSMFSIEDLQGMFRVDDVEQELAKLKTCHDEAMALFGDIVKEKQDPKTFLQKCVFVLQNDEIRRKFDRIFLDFAKSMDFLLPDLRVDPFMKDFKLLSLIRQGAINLYRDEILAKDELSNKIVALIHAHITAEGIEELLAPLTITAPDFKEKLAGKGSDKAKAVHLEYALKDTITHQVSEDRAFYGSLQKQLEGIIEEKKKERIDDANAIQQYMKMKDHIESRDSIARSLGLESGQEFAIYGLLNDIKDKCPFDSNDITASSAKELVNIVHQHMVEEWAEREDIQREMRRDIKRYLRANGCKEEHLAEVVREIMETALQWAK